MAAPHELAAVPVSGSMVPSLRALAPRLVIVGILPVVAYAILRPHVASDGIALTAVMVFPLADVLTERARHKRFEPLGMIVLIGIAVGLGAAVALHGDTLMLKVRESVVTGVFGIICLVSLSARATGDVLSGASVRHRRKRRRGRAVQPRDGNCLRFPPRFRLTTLVWGIGLVGEAGLRIGLALVLPTQAFLVVAQIISWTVLAGLFWFTTVYSRAALEAHGASRRARRGFGRRAQGLGERRSLAGTALGVVDDRAVIAGRQTEAVQAFQQARKTLTADFGLEPGPELVALERAILDHDLRLDAPELGFSAFGALLSDRVSAAALASSSIRETAWRRSQSSRAPLPRLATGAASPSRATT